MTPRAKHSNGRVGLRPTLNQMRTSTLLKGEQASTQLFEAYTLGAAFSASFLDASLRDQMFPLQSEVVRGELEGIRKVGLGESWFDWPPKWVSACGRPFIRFASALESRRQTQGTFRPSLR